MQNLLYRLRNFMYGRYGADKLGYFLIALSCLAAFIRIFFNSSLLSAIQLIGLILFFARFFSKNTARRYEENRRFMSLSGRVSGLFYKIKRWACFQKTKLSEIKTHRYIKCPHCRAVIRVPYSRGKHTLKCPKCAGKFETRIW